MLSVIVPAFDEERYLPETLAALRTASELVPCEVIVVDNNSSDGTRDVAARWGASVVAEPVHNIARVKNTGARAARGDVLVFIDADTLVPPSLFVDIADVMRVGPCLGGAVAVAYTGFRRRWMRWYVKGWAFWGRVFNMKQGAAQFCRKETFLAIGGFDERLYMGEDIEFYWRLTRHTRRIGGFLQFIREPRVVSSSRRFDRMGVWRVLVSTHPVVIWLNRKQSSAWKDWYDTPVR